MFKFFYNANSLDLNINKSIFLISTSANVGLHPSYASCHLCKTRVLQSLWFYLTRLTTCRWSEMPRNTSKFWAQSLSCWRLLHLILCLSFGQPLGNASLYNFSAFCWLTLLSLVQISYWFKSPTEDGLYPGYRTAARRFFHIKLVAQIVL